MKTFILSLTLSVLTSAVIASPASMVAKDSSPMVIQYWNSSFAGSSLFSVLLPESVQSLQATNASGAAEILEGNEEVILFNPYGQYGFSFSQSAQRNVKTQIARWLEGDSSVRGTSFTAEGNKGSFTILGWNSALKNDEFTVVAPKAKIVGILQYGSRRLVLAAVKSVFFTEESGARRVVQVTLPVGDATSLFEMTAKSTEADLYRIAVHYPARIHADDVVQYADGTIRLVNWAQETTLAQAK